MPNCTVLPVFRKSEHLSQVQCGYWEITESVQENNSFFLEAGDQWCCLVNDDEDGDGIVPVQLCSVTRQSYCVTLVG